MYGGSDSDEGETREVRFLKSNTVFNVAQISCLPARFHPEPADESPAPSTAERLLEVDAYFAATGARRRA